MPAITVMQPWADLILSGIKLVENRHAGTGYRGPLALHASKRIDEDALYDRPVRAALGLPRTPGDPWTTATVARWHATAGHVLGVVELTDSHPALGGVGCCHAWGRQQEPALERFPRHLVFGPDLRTLVRAVPARGALGVWCLDVAALDTAGLVHDDDRPLLVSAAPVGLIGVGR